jgi:hypothetical protein
MEMEIELTGKVIKLNVTSLGQPMDSYLKKLFTKFLSNFGEPYPELMKDSCDELREITHSYFDNKIDNPPGQDFLFNNLTIIWKNYQNKGRLGEAQLFWQDILKIVQDWEEKRHKRIHKGSLFYFWSQTAILQGQFDKGFFLIHSAYEEDVLTHKSELPATPAFKTVSLNYSAMDNLLYGLVEDWAKYLNEFIEKYQKLSDSKFSLDDFQNNFLNKPPDRETLFSFTYTLARYFYFDKYIPSAIVTGDFASLFELNTLFDLVLVIDSFIYSTLKKPGQNDWGFKNLAKHLLLKSGIKNNDKNTSDYLNEINTARKNNFEATLNLLLDQAFTYRDKTSPLRLECDIGLALCIRNYSAHKIGSFPVIRERYSEVRQSLFNVLFLAVEKLS